MIPLQRLLPLLRDHQPSTHTQHDFVNRIQTWTNTETLAIRRRFPLAESSLCRRLGAANAERKAILANTLAAWANDDRITNVLSSWTSTVNEYLDAPSGISPGLSDPPLQKRTARLPGSGAVHGWSASKVDTRVNCPICHEEGIRRGRDYR